MEIKILASRPYSVLVGRDIAGSIGNYVEGRQVAVITDDIVNGLYAGNIEASLSKNNRVCKFVFKNGEDSKNINTLSHILEFLAKERLTRSDLLVALGGGVVGDIAGMAASIYLRGIEFIGVPTTFLSAIDSSVGGKTGINLENGKNLAGAFWQPSLVLCDCNTFKTLPQKVFSDGVAEAIKYGMIQSPDILSKLEDVNFNVEETAAACIKIKGDIVHRDEHDTGERQLLNFGHTIGHGIEKCSNYKISHGSAVAIGMAVITRWAEKAGFAENCYNKLTSLIKKYNLPTHTTLGAKALLNAMLSDKKRSGDSITLVIPKEYGRCALHKVAVCDLGDILETGLGGVN
jgi:3-dehydroquinate synthase